MADDKDVVIEIPADEPGTDPKPEAQQGERKPVAAAPETPPAKTDDEGIEDLKGQLKTLQERAEAEKAARERSDQIAAQKAEEARVAREAEQRAKGEAHDGQTSAVENAIAAAQAEADAAAREHQSALEAGDYAKATEAQRKIARAEAKVVRLEEAKDDLADRKVEPEPERKPAPAAVDPFEAAIANAPPRSQAWLRAHRDYVTDPNLQRKASAAHNMALSEGHQPETDAYFDYCETFLGLKQADDPEPEIPAPPQRKPRTAMPAAPVSRDTPTPTNGNLGSGQVVLTPGEQRAATDGTVVWNFSDDKIGAVKGEPIGLREYARRKASMTKEGRYDRSMTDQ